MKVTQKVEVVLIQHRRFVIAFRHQIAQMLRRAGESERIRRDMLQKKLVRRFLIFAELHAAIGIIKVWHGVQRVVVDRYVIEGVCCCQN